MLVPQALSATVPGGGPVRRGAPRSPAVGLYDEARRRPIDDAELDAALTGVDHERAALLVPGSRLLDQAIVRPRHEEMGGPAPTGREPLPRPARQGNGVVLGAVDGPLGRVLLEDMHPPRPEQPIAGRPLG